MRRADLVICRVCGRTAPAPLKHVRQSLTFGQFYPQRRGVCPACDTTGEKARPS